MQGVVSALDALAGVANDGRDAASSSASSRSAMSVADSDRAVRLKRPRTTSSRMRYLRHREEGGPARPSARLRAWIEGETLRKLDTGEYIDLDKEPVLVRSTISIAFSHDGRFFASTHGDHSVKVFEYPSRRQIACLEGHPRTPWTVRFHPTDSSIVASGCLGNECRVWNVKNKKCIRKHSFRGSISCVSFSPSGDFLAVTSGRSLLLWSYAEPTADGSIFTRTATDVPDPNDTSPPTPEDTPRPQSGKGMPIELLSGENPFHMVDFHPSGHMLMTGEKNRPPLTEEGENEISQDDQFTLKIVVHRFDRRMGVKFAPPVLTVPRVVAYNDAGIHFSPCGKMLAACVPVESESRDFHIAVMSLYSALTKPVGTVLYSAPLGKGHVSALTNLKFSSTSTHLLAGFSFRPHNPVLRRDFDENSQGLNSDGSSRSPALAPCGVLLRPHLPQVRVVDIFRVDEEFKLIRSLGADVDINDQTVGGAEDEINVAVFAPRLGISDGIIYGTQKGRIRMFQQASGRKSYPPGICDDNCKFQKVTGAFNSQSTALVSLPGVWARCPALGTRPTPPPAPLPRIAQPPTHGVTERPLTTHAAPPGAIGVFLESSYRRAWPVAGAARPSRRPPPMSVHQYTPSAAIEDILASTGRTREPMAPTLPPLSMNRPPQSNGSGEGGL